MRRLFGSRPGRNALRLVEPFVAGNRRLYENLNAQSMALLQKHGNKLPSFVTANHITTARTSLIFPTLALYSNGYALIPASMVVLNLTFDYVDGAFARWEREHRPPQTSEEIDAGLESARSKRLRSTFGAYYDAIADKFFAIPLWLCIFQNSCDQPMLQAATLSLAMIEVYSSFVRTKAYFEEPSPLPQVSGKEESEAREPQSAVVASSVGKAKQALAMTGTALCMFHSLDPLGTVLLGLSIPLAISSVLEKDTSCTVYCEIICRAEEPMVESLQFLELAKGLGTKLVVGMRLDKSEEPHVDKREVERMQQLLLMNHSVHRVLPPPAVPPKIDQQFLDSHGAEVVAVRAEESFAEASALYDSSLYRAGRIVPLNTTLEAPS